MQGIVSLFSRSLSLGPVTLPFWLAAAVLVLAAGTSVNRLLLSRRKRLRRELSSIMTSAFIVLIVTAKLSPLLFSASSVFRQPLLLLYGWGGTAGGILALCASAAFIVYSLVKRRIPPGWSLAPLIAYGAAGGLAVVILAVAISSSREVRSPVDFELTDISGTVHTSVQYRGRMVILNFWASWCPPCRAEVPELNTFNASIDGDGPVFLSVNLTGSESGRGAVIDFAEQTGIEYPILLDSGNRLSNLLGIRYLPTTMIIDTDGVPIESRSGAVSASWLRSRSLRR